jgi:enoyl-CoA hydratase
MYETIKYGTDVAVTMLTLARPDARNAINRVMRREIEQALQDAGDDPLVSVLLLAAEGKSFCAGRDLGEVRENAGKDLEEIQADYEASKAFFDAFQRFPKPIIAAVSGHAIGFGCSMLAYCDIVVADTSAQFGFPEITMGIVPGIAAVKFAEVVGRRTLRKMLLLGKRYSAEEARAMSIISEVVANGEAVGKALEYAALLARLPPTTAMLTKSVLERLGESDYEAKAQAALTAMGTAAAAKRK